MMDLWWVHQRNLPKSDHVNEEAVSVFWNTTWTNANVDAYPFVWNFLCSPCFVIQFERCSNVRSTCFALIASATSCQCLTWDSHNTVEQLATNCDDPCYKINLNSHVTALNQIYYDSSSCFDSHWTWHVFGVNHYGSSSFFDSHWPWHMFGVNKVLQGWQRCVCKQIRK